LLAKSVARMQELQDQVCARWALLFIFRTRGAAHVRRQSAKAARGLFLQGAPVRVTESRLSLVHHTLRAGTSAHRYLQPLVLRGGAGRAGAPRDSGTRAVVPALLDKSLWRGRFEDVWAFERYLARNGAAIRKCVLDLPEERVEKRFLAPLGQPAEELAIVCRRNLSCMVSSPLV